MVEIVVFPRRSRVDHWDCSFEFPMILPVNELNRLAKRLQKKPGAWLHKEAREILNGANTGWGWGGHSWELDQIVPPHLRDEEIRDARFPGGMATPTGVEVLDHMVTVKGRIIKPGQTRGWMYPAGFITQPYCEAEQAKIILHKMFPSCQVIGLPTPSWHHKHCSVLAVLRQDVEVHLRGPGNKMRRA